MVAPGRQHRAAGVISVGPYERPFGDARWRADGVAATTSSTQPQALEAGSPVDPEGNTGLLPRQDVPDQFGPSAECGTRMRSKEFREHGRRLSR